MNFQQTIDDLFLSQCNEWESVDAAIKQYHQLCNHLTIPFHSHVQRCIHKKIDDMLKPAELFSDHAVFYNRPKCGTLAPDRLHLQAGLKMPTLLSGEKASCDVPWQYKPEGNEQLLISPATIDRVGLIIDNYL